MSIRNGMPGSELPEVTWRKSRRSGPQGGNCVEVAHLPGGQVAVRNSRHPAGPTLVFTSAEWAAFVGGAGTASSAKPALPSSRCAISTQPAVPLALLLTSADW